MSVAEPAIHSKRRTHRSHWPNRVEGTWTGMRAPICTHSDVARKRSVRSPISERRPLVRAAELVAEVHLNAIVGDRLQQIRDGGQMLLAKRCEFGP
jgi:hypothetical protein